MQTIRRECLDNSEIQNDALDFDDSIKKTQEHTAITSRISLSKFLGTKPDPIA